MTETESDLDYIIRKRSYSYFIPVTIVFCFPSWFFFSLTLTSLPSLSLIGIATAM